MSAMRVQVKDFMSPQVTTAIGENSVEEIRSLMKEKNIHAIPIVSYSTDQVDAKKTIRGIITATDINMEIHNDALVKDIMTETNVQVVHSTSSAQAAAKMMLRNHIHHVVVMDDGEITGIISAFDFVKLVAEKSLA